MGKQYYSIISVISILAALAMLFISIFLSISNSVALESEITRLNVERATNAMTNELRILDITANDYAEWDDTYYFMDSVNQSYIKSNLTDNTFNNNKLNLFVFVNSSGQIIWGKIFDLKNQREIPFTQTIQKELVNLFSHNTNAESEFPGIVFLADKPMLLAARPVLTSLGEGPARGLLIMGRYLDDAKIQQLSNSSQLSLNICQVKNTRPESDFSIALTALLTKETTFIYELSDDLIAGYKLLNDVQGNPAIVLRVDVNRTIHKKNQRDLFYFALSLLLVGIIFGLVNRIIVRKRVMAHFALLCNRIIEIGKSNDPSARISIVGPKELVSLSNAVNAMLEELERAQQEVRNKELSYRTIFETTGTITMIIEKNRTISMVNTQFEHQSGFLRNEVENTMKWNQLVAEEDWGKMHEYISLIEQDVPIPSSFECRMRNKDGNVMDTLITMAAVPGSNKFVVSAWDVTRRKEMEEKLKYLSQHDVLTGLHNRGYFEQEIRRLATADYYPVVVIVADVDGLKLVNDSLGHNNGDRLLKGTADILKNCFRAGDVVTRIGGDEFVALLPNTDMNIAEGFRRNIVEAIANYNIEHPELHLSLSIGIAVGIDESTTMEELFKEADNNMYREKLHSSLSARSAIVNALMKTVEARNFVTQGHANRVQDIVVNMAKSIGFSEADTNDLKLLAQFHDIGKVGVPDRILSKQGPLNPEELVEMRLHCEIGYRIAQSAPALAPIADWVLKHHEWWNGEGYPQGLKGEDIPIECRLLAIADAYDAMTSDRPYRKAMLEHEAVAELRKYAGIQFDPTLVDIFMGVTR